MTDEPSLTRDIDGIVTVNWPDGPRRRTYEVAPEIIDQMTETHNAWKRSEATLAKVQDAVLKRDWTALDDLLFANAFLPRSGQEVTP